MKLNRVFNKIIERDGDGFSVRAAINAVTAVNVDEKSATTSASSNQHVNANEQDEEDQMSDYKPLSREELSSLAGEELPERAAMSLINANVAIPINAAVAANVLSDNSAAVANAAQTAAINQGN